ncbi:DUF1624 domain-containing protein [Mucilaginibacter sp. SG564]|uniref:DUF1624 domain-containing protein n=1 Tax=Mucilaginibacter sp. SG564 TaxID=2587022 RepID=UPI001554EB0C|nr:heparan-alpha-glucosaminide N-acetyltransferase domain-containing protein [Mucilaginibacter sp. SG564]NOW98605.1 putative membrane protein [Mucilaginibacter sp. SG564]
MPPPTENKQRVQSIDVLRGLIMLVMALDHVRDFFHLSNVNPTDMATTTPFLFFTRWITHFCAPTFVFLSGVSANLAGSRRSPGEFSGFLIKRGLWLIAVEVVLMTLAISANPFYNFIILQVIWAIGISMIILGLLNRLPIKVIGFIGLLLFFGHNLFDLPGLFNPATAGSATKILFTASAAIIPLGKSHFIFCLYAILPWTSVMLLGYTFGALYRSGYDAVLRRRQLRYAGLITLGIFVIVRAINIYGDPAPWAVQRNALFTVMSFLNTTKYPCSLLYLCMTLGVSLLLLSYFEKIQNKVTDIFNIYGKVPFFYYVPHFYIIRVLSIIFFFAWGYTSKDIGTPQSPLWFRPPSFGYSLLVVYLIWLLVIASLYFPCRWFGKYKQTHKQWWLSYL